MAAVTERRTRTPAWILNGVLPLSGKRIPLDIAAGATLAALAIPETMGYASMAQMPVITGLYTILIPLFLFAVLGSSRHLVVGADSATAMTMAAGLTALGLVGGSSEWIAMAGLSALMVGVVLILARLLKLGFLAYFLSRSVLIGFLTGVGIQVAMTQLAGVLGVPKPAGGVLEQFVKTLQEIPQTNVATLAVSVAVWVIILGSDRINKRIPGALIAVVLMIAISYLGLLPSSVTLLGAVQGGLPPIGLPQGVITVSNVLALLPIVLSCFLIILAQSAATSRAYAMKYRDSFDENVDLIGLAAANFGAGVSGTWLVNGSPTKTEMVDGAGGRSQVAQLTAGLVVLVVLLFLTPALAYMPNAVLAAVVMLIGIRLIDILGMRGIARVRTGEFVVAAITAATVVLVGIEQAILLAIALSIVEHIDHSYHPFDRLLTSKPGGDYGFEEVATGAQALPGLVIYRFGASLYYANGNRFSEEIVHLVEDADPPLRWLCVSATSIGDIDYSGAETIEAVREEILGHGVTLVFADVDPKISGQLDAYELTDKIGKDHIFASLLEAIAAFGATAGSAAPAVAPATTGNGPAPAPSTG
ncbi:MAG TPA: SulP family inorganic anion transporter [Candidatus Limnocylindrales bacterium]